MGAEREGPGRRLSDQQKHMNDLTAELGKIERKCDLLSCINRDLETENAELRRRIGRLEAELSSKTTTMTEPT